MRRDAPHFDVIIAGAGIVGLATAWQLINRYPGLRIAILEKEIKPALHQSSRNSGVIHSGIYYHPGSAKAENCLKGYRMLLDFASEYDIPFSLCGKLIAAVEPQEIPVLHEIYARGVAHGMQGIALLDTKAAAGVEPHVRAHEAIWVPQAGIIDYGEVCRTLARRAQDRGVSIYYEHVVTDLQRIPGGISVASGFGDFTTPLFINCTGLYADRVAMLSEMTGRFMIMPFRGEFYTLTGASAGLVKHLVYPVPDQRFPFLGVHLTPRLDGTMEAGPNAVLAFAREGYRLGSVHAGDLSEILTYGGFYRMAMRYWGKGWEEMRRSVSKQAFHKAVQRLVPDIRKGDMVPGRSGVRAQCVASNGTMIYDYLVLEDTHLINLVNAPSPAATSALAIGAFLTDKAAARLDG